MSYTPAVVPAGEIARGVIRLMGARGLASVAELSLANGRRADITALGPSGEIEIVEIKSCLADYRADGKWPDYRAFCDRFFFAVAEGFPAETIPDHCGLIIADGFGGAILREPDTHRLAPARRKAVTLRFAHLAARRLNADALTGLDAGFGLAT